MNHNGKSRDELTRQANLVRTKLLHTVEQLDHRRHEVLDLRLQLRRHLRDLAIVGGILLVATSAGVALAVQRIANAAQRRRRGRWILARDLWRHPDRAMRGERRSFLGQVLRSLALTVVTAAVTIPARRLVAELVAGKAPPAR
jgi:hypothetical protein